MAAVACEADGGPEMGPPPPTRVAVVAVGLSAPTPEPHPSPASCAPTAVLRKAVASSRAPRLQPGSSRRHACGRVKPPYPSCPTRGPRR